MVFANLVPYPTNIAAWLVVGLTVGWLAGKVMENPSLGIKSDLLLGSIGAVACGALPGFFVDGDPGFWVSVASALIGAFPTVACGRTIVARQWA